MYGPNVSIGDVFGIKPNRAGGAVNLKVVTQSQIDEDGGLNPQCIDPVCVVRFIETNICIY